MGPSTLRLSVHDLSVDGCRIESRYEIAIIDRLLAIQIDLPGEGWISLRAETLYGCEGLGFVVRFVDLAEANRGRIERTIERLLGATELHWQIPLQA